ncbi:MAG: DsbE family thiol:disulfide interchange protein [Alphaproteobacteria bacterium]
MTIRDLPAAPETEHAAQPPAAGPRRSRWVLFGPAALFLGLVLTFVAGLGRDPKILPSPLIGKPVPEFSLPPVEGRRLGLATGDLKGEVSLVNVFASWCLACREEHPLLMRLQARGDLPLHGLNYKDKPADAARWLDQMGDPYRRTGADLDGKVAIDWGVYGVPETFLVDAQGRIAFKQIGPLTPEIVETTILPLVAKLRASSSKSAVGP